MSSIRTRLLVVAGSSLVGIVVASVLWNRRPEPATVTLVDNRDAVSVLLLERERDGGSRPNPTSEPELYREPMSEDDAITLYSGLRKGGKRNVYDPFTYFWEVPHYFMPCPLKEHPQGGYAIRTNKLGIRKSVEVLDAKPDMRILVGGDSHTAGIVPNHEQFGNLLQTQLSISTPSLGIEVLNGGKGGYQFYNYVGTLEKFGHLEPDAYVVAVYGGNDFFGVLSTFRYFNRLPPPPLVGWPEQELWDRICEQSTPVVAQDLSQVVAFRKHPEDVEIARAVARQSLTTMKRICAEDDVELVVVYIPPVRDVQFAKVEDKFSGPIEMLNLSPGDLAITDRLADELLEVVRGLGVKCIDMRPVFRKEQRACYWHTDLHLNTHGHKLIAAELEAHFGPELASRARKGH